MLRSLRRSAFTVAILAVAAFAQVPSVGDTTSPPPNLPGHALIAGPHEVVNPANGSVALSFPVRMPPGRGITLPFSILYSSNGQRFVTNTNSASVGWKTQDEVLGANGGTTPCRSST